MEYLNKVVCKDNIDLLKSIPSESIDLVYIDPPFFTQRSFRNKEGVGFDDKFESIAHYVAWLKFRVIEIHRLLKATGSFYCHLDCHAVHYVKVMLDEIFGYKNFKNEIIWQRKIGSNSSRGARKYPNNTDIILFHTKSKRYTFNPPYIDDSKNLPDSITKAYKYDDNDGKGLYLLGPLETLRYSPSLQFDFMGLKHPKKGWRWNKERMKRAYSDGLLVISKNKKSIRQKIYLNKRKGMVVESIWKDIRCLMGSSNEYTGWPTQKPLALLERIIKASSNEGDLVLDCFAGCGTTLVAAKKLGRNYIGCDSNPDAVRITKERLEKITQ